MFFILPFLRSFSPVQALARYWLTTILLSSALCFFLVSSYTIDDSCRNYKGNDITGDIQRAINEVKDMATNAYSASSLEGERYTRLMTLLFGSWSKRHEVVAGWFGIFSALGPSDDFVIICDDLTVNWDPVDTYNPQPDPMGVWADHRHHWITGWSEYYPCDDTRKMGSSKSPWAFTMLGRLIYLCPSILDKPTGRSVARYKDQILAGQWIDNYVCLPVILFHQLLCLSRRKPSSSK